MQTAQHATPVTGMPMASQSGSNSAQPNPLNHYQIIRRNGAVVPFEPNKIAVAMM